MVIINPATSVWCSYYSRFAAFLHAHGFDVITYDYRGIGGSRPASLRGLHAGWLDWGRLDFEAGLRLASSTFPRQPEQVVAHSIGGVLVGLAPSNHLIDRVFTMGAQFAHGRDYAIHKRFGMLIKSHAIMPVLDNGADPKLIFDDIANLIRLARVDFGIEITTSDETPKQPKTLRINFDHVALSFHEFAKRPECIAVRLITRFPNDLHGQILVIKPRLTTMASHDVWEYRQDMDSFPHESTADQFFNDVQWECHRALGESEAKCLFATGRRRSD